MLCSRIFVILALAIVGPLASATPESFAKTLAHGTKIWQIKNAVATILVTGQEPLKLNCTTDTVTSIGNFPNYKFSIGDLKCGPRENPREIMQLKLLINLSEYTARHIPADTAPNQFRLELSKAPTYPVMQQSNSLNAMTIEDLIFVDISGEAKSRMIYGGPTYYYASASVKRVDDKTKLAISMQISDHSANNGGKRTEIELQADLEPKK